MILKDIVIQIRGNSFLQVSNNIETNLIKHQKNKLQLRNDKSLMIKDHESR